jgi:glycosyltransferase involved in cell wall biosynthesis
MDISVVVPLFNEEESLPELTVWIDRVMKANNFTYEVWLIDDGSTDGSWKVVQELRDKNPMSKGMLLSQWMPTFRTAQTKFPNSTAW